MTQIPKDYRPLVKQARKQGWKFVQKKGHPKMVSPEGYATPLPSSSNAPGTYQEFKARLRRNGVDVDLATGKK